MFIFILGKLDWNLLSQKRETEYTRSYIYSFIAACDKRDSGVAREARLQTNGACLHPGSPSFPLLPSPEAVHHGTVSNGKPRDASPRVLDSLATLFRRRGEKRRIGNFLKLGIILFLQQVCTPVKFESVIIQILFFENRDKEIGNSENIAFNNAVKIISSGKNTRLKEFSRTCLIYTQLFTSLCSETLRWNGKRGGKRGGGGELFTRVGRCNWEWEVHLSRSFIFRSRSVCREESSEASLKNWSPHFYCHSSHENSQIKVAYFGEKEKRRERWMDGWMIALKAKAVSMRYTLILKTRSSSNGFCLCFCLSTEFFPRW